MKIGDFVRSNKWKGVEGIVQDLRPCTSDECEEMALTLDPAGSDVRGYYHTESFTVVTPTAE